MIDEPQAGPDADQPEKGEANGTGVAATPARNIETASTPKQKTHYPGNSRKYAQYIVRPMKAIWRFLGSVVGFLDKYDGAITAIATVAIVALTFVYVRYSKRQWQVMSGQLEQMRQQLPQMQAATKAAQDNAKAAQDTLENQKQIARLAYGPIVEWNTLSVFHDDQVRQMWAKMTFQNDGKMRAKFIRVAVQIDFRKSIPTESDYRFKDPADFTFTAPSRLTTFTKDELAYLTLDKKRSIPRDYKSQNLYVWGEIVYESFGTKDSSLFCIYGPTEGYDIFDTQFSGSKGYGGTWIECPTPEQKRK